jgi:hypothetical protein
MASVLTRAAWNSIIDQINALIAKCGSTIAPLVEVPEKHIWTVQDVTLVRNTLTQLCTSSNPTFSASTKLWSQAIITEINNAIANCQCGPLTFYAPAQMALCNIGSLTVQEYYIGGTALQVTPQLQLGEVAGVSGWWPPTEQFPFEIASIGWNVPVNCSGSMVYAAAQNQANGQQYAASACLPSGSLLVAETSSIPSGSDLPAYTISAKIIVGTNPSAYRTVPSCSAIDYCIDFSVTGLATITLGQSRQWFPTLTALDSAIAAYNTAHPTKQVRLSSLQPWTAYWPNTAYNQVLFNNLNYVILANV